MRYAKAFKYKQWANKQLLAFAARQLHLLPEEGATFFLRILNHTAVVDSLFISRILGEPEKYDADNTEETPTLAVLSKRIAHHDAWLVEFTESNADLCRLINFKFTDGDTGQLSIEEILLHLLTHSSNHRGMASRTLASNGLDRPKDTLTGYLHEVEPARRRASDEATMQN